MKNTDLQIANFYIKKNEQAKRSGITLSKTKECFYTGLELDDKTWSLDRIDNRIGYTSKNTVVCHKQINGLKGQIENPSFLPSLSDVIEAFSIWESLK